MGNGKCIAWVYLARCEKPGMKYGFLSESKPLCISPAICSFRVIWGHQFRAGLWSLLPLYLDLALGKVGEWMGPSVSVGPWSLPSVPFPLLKSPNPLSGTQRPHNLFSWLVEMCFLKRNWCWSFISQLRWVKTLCSFFQGELTVKALKALFLIEECQTLFPVGAFWAPGSSQGRGAPPPLASRLTAHLYTSFPPWSVSPTPHSRTRGKAAEKAEDIVSTPGTYYQ